MHVRAGWAMTALLALCGGTLTALAGVDVDYYFSFFEVGWVNYYELLAWDMEEEIEVLGWLVGFENILALLWVSYLLSMACLCLVSLILLARRVRFASLDQEAYLRRARYFLCFKTQNTVVQEADSIGATKHTFNLFHRRRI